MVDQTRVWDVFLRVGLAMLVGGAIGINRDLHGKPVGVRTLGLVATTGCMLVLVAMQFGGPHGGDAVSRVTQGLLTGIGFLGAGVIIRAPGESHVYGLTTAACIVTVSALGVACGAADWAVLLAGVMAVMVLLIFGGPLERAVHSRLHPGDSGLPVDHASKNQGP